MSGHQEEQQDRQRTIEGVKQVCGSSYSLLTLCKRAAASAVEDGEARPSCKGQVVCMGETSKKWARAWSGKEVVEQCVRQRERDRLALVRPILDGWAVGRADSGQGVRE